MEIISYIKSLEESRKGLYERQITNFVSKEFLQLEEIVDLLQEPGRQEKLPL